MQTAANAEHLLEWEEQCERNFIGGEWRFTREGYEFDIYDPADSSVIAAIPLSTHRDIREMMAAAKDGLEDWNLFSRAERVSILRKALGLLEDSIDLVASIVSRDTGLPLAHAKADLLQVIGETQMRLLSDEAAQTQVPGVIGQILSWSNPLAVCIQTLTMDLANGDTAIVHPSIKAPLSLVYLADVLSRAGAAGGVFNLVQGAGTDAGMALARQADLKRLDFQGSRRTADMVSLSPSRNGVPVQTFFREVQTRTLSADSDIAAIAGEIAASCFCHGAKPGFGGIEVSLPLERLSEFAEAMALNFRRASYFDGNYGSHSIAPFLAEIFRIRSETAIDRYLSSGAELVCQTQEPDERTSRMGWFSQARVIHDLTGRINLDPEFPNGPLILVKTH